MSLQASQLDSLLLWRKWPGARRGLEHASDGVRHIELADAIVRVKIAGSGARTVVMTPDPPNVIEHYDALYAALAHDVRLVCYEMPGFGHSVPRRRYGFGIEENAKVLVELLEKLVAGPSLLALSCVAGLTAIKVARERPDLVSHVIAIQTPSLREERRWAERVDRRGIVRTPVLGQLTLAFRHQQVARDWYRAALGASSDAPAFTDVANRAFDAGASFCLASGMQALARASDSWFGAITQPSSCIWGTRDRTHRRTDRRSTRSYLPAGARSVEFEDAGHFPELERPGRFREELLRLLSPEV